MSTTEQCMICLDGFNDTNKAYSIGCAGTHLIHSNCLYQYIHSKLSYTQKEEMCFQCVSGKCSIYIPNFYDNSLDIGCPTCKSSIYVSKNTSFSQIHQRLLSESTPKYVGLKKSVEERQKVSFQIQEKIQSMIEILDSQSNINVIRGNESALLEFDRLIEETKKELSEFHRKESERISL